MFKKYNKERRSDSFRCDGVFVRDESFDDIRCGGQFRTKQARYADGYESYSPKSVFEASYIECDEECNINPKNLIAEEERFMTDGALGIGVKLACINAKLINGDVVFQCKAVMWDELDDETLYEQVRDKVLEEIKCRCRFAEVTAKNGLDSVARKGS